MIASHDTRFGAGSAERTVPVLYMYASCTMPVTNAVYKEPRAGLCSAYLSHHHPAPG